MAGIDEVTVVVPNSVVLAGDPSADPPTTMTGVIGVATGCLAVGTASESDGTPTRIRLATGAMLLDVESLRLAFDGRVALGRAKFVVSSVYGEEYLGAAIASAAPRVRIWVDSDVEPTDVAIAVSE